MQRFVRLLENFRFAPRKRETPDVLRSKLGSTVTLCLFEISQYRKDSVALQAACTAKLVNCLGILDPQLVRDFNQTIGIGDGFLPLPNVPSLSILPLYKVDRGRCAV